MREKRKKKFKRKRTFDKFGPKLYKFCTVAGKFLFLAWFCTFCKEINLNYCKKCRLTSVFFLS